MHPVSGDAVAKTLTVKIWANHNLPPGQINRMPHETRPLIQDFLAGVHRLLKKTGAVLKATLNNSQIMTPRKDGEQTYELRACYLNALS